MTCAEDLDRVVAQAIEVDRAAVPRMTWAHPKRKLTVHQVADARLRWSAADGERYGLLAALSRELRVDRKTLWKALLGVTYKEPQT